MRLPTPCLLLLGLLAPGLAAAETAPRVFMAGDSTMADKPLDGPERGWGQLLPKFFSDPAIVHNHAVNGRSTKSFIDEGRWQKIVDELQAGDFVIIQFSHNDEKSEDPKRYTDPATSFRDNLRRFIREAREKKASPILATPVCRRKFNAEGNLIDTHGAYPDAMRAVAAEEKVPLLELNRATAALLTEEGPEPSKKFFMWFSPGEHPKLPKGVQDDTHFVEAGATKVAGLAVAQLREQKSPLVRWLK
ncbi:MAG TPA: rhamnogalacturonan acetylesterase [Opitutaceae bacterium]|nr:rhamnogalacturonan acetylesterase [Opitutaceae bacterium]